MGRRCTICDHPKRGEIDEALVGATLPYRHIAERYDLAWSSAFRHAATHIPALLAEARRDELEAQATTLLERVQQLEDKANFWHEEAADLLRTAKARETAAEEAARDAADELAAVAKAAAGGKRRRSTIVMGAGKPPDLADRTAAIRVGTRAVATIGHVLDLLGRVTGEIRPTQINVSVALLVQAIEKIEKPSEARDVLVSLGERAIAGLPPAEQERKRALLAEFAAGGDGT